MADAPLPDRWTADDVESNGAGHTVFRDEREAATRELREFLDGV